MGDPISTTMLVMQILDHIDLLFNGTPRRSNPIITEPSKNNTNLYNFINLIFVVIALSQKFYGHNFGLSCVQMLMLKHAHAK